MEGSAKWMAAAIVAAVQVGGWAAVFVTAKRSAAPVVATAQAWKEIGAAQERERCQRCHDAPTDQSNVIPLQRGRTHIRGKLHLTWVSTQGDRW